MFCKRLTSQCLTRERCKTRNPICPTSNEIESLCPRLSFYSSSFYFILIFISLFFFFSPIFSLLLFHLIPLSFTLYTYTALTFIHSPHSFSPLFIDKETNRRGDKLLVKSKTASLRARYRMD